MKPSPFTYHAPQSLDEALDLMSSLDNARVIAGGQSLMPMMNFRIVQPDHLIDLGRIPELVFLDRGTGSLNVGAMTTQRAIENSPTVRDCCPLLADALLHVGHQQTRNRGTIGGSLCHLDPSAELSVTACALDAVLTAASKERGRRTIKFSDFAAGYLATNLEPDEILVQIGLPVASPKTGTAFEEFAIRPADFAIVSIAAVIVLNRQQSVVEARLAAGGISPTPKRLSSIETFLIGQPANAGLANAAAAAAATLPCDGNEDNPPEYRQELVGYLTERALNKAISRAAP